jgi:DNA repair photolyase
MAAKNHILYKNAKEGNSHAFHVNFYNGCSHGCKYCYGCYMKERSGDGNYTKWTKPVAVQNAVELLKEDITHVRDKGEVFVESVSDAYMPDVDTKVTRRVLELLALSGFTIFILTKNASVIRDLDLFKRINQRIKVGFTIVTPNDELRKRVEPNSSPIEERIAVLKELHEAGLHTVVSLEPLLPNVNIEDYIEFVEEIDPYVSSYEPVGKLSVNIPFEFINDEEWRGIDSGRYDTHYVELFKVLLPKLGNKYRIAEHSRVFLDKYRIPFSDKPIKLSSLCDYNPF